VGGGKGAVVLRVRRFLVWCGACLRRLTGKGNRGGRKNGH